MQRLFETSAFQAADEEQWYGLFFIRQQRLKIEMNFVCYQAIETIAIEEGKVRGSFVI